MAATRRVVQCVTATIYRKPRRIAMLGDAVRPVDGYVAQTIRIDPMLGKRHRGPRPLVNRCRPYRHRLPLLRDDRRLMYAVLHCQLRRSQLTSQPIQRHLHLEVGRTPLPLARHRSVLQQRRTKLNHPS